MPGGLHQRQHYAFSYIYIHKKLIHVRAVSPCQRLPQIVLIVSSHIFITNYKASLTETGIADHGNVLLVQNEKKEIVDFRFGLRPNEQSQFYIKHTFTTSLLIHDAVHQITFSTNFAIYSMTAQTKTVFRISYL